MKNPIKPLRKPPETLDELIDSGKTFVVDIESVKENHPGGLRDFLTCDACKSGDHDNCRADSWYPLCQCRCWIDRRRKQK